MYMTLKFDDNGCCRIHSISDDGPSSIVNGGTSALFIFMALLAL